MLRIRFFQRKIHWCVVFARIGETPENVASLPGRIVIDVETRGRHSA
jgi:hypothetical protein